MKERVKEGSREKMESFWIAPQLPCVLEVRIMVTCMIRGTVVCSIAKPSCSACCEKLM